MRIFISRMAVIFMLIGCVLAINAVLQNAISVWGALLVLPAFGWITLRLFYQAARPARRRRARAVAAQRVALRVAPSHPGNGPKAA